MKLNHNQSTDINQIKMVDKSNILINDQLFNQSCIVGADHIIVDLNITHIEQLSNDHVDQLLTLNPDVIILGSGELHGFPAVDVLQPIAVKDIGFEVMNNKSAARTYNVLIAEERKVVCLLILD